MTESPDRLTDRLAAGLTAQTVSVAEAAARMGLSEATLRRRIERGRQPAIRLPGAVLVDVADLPPAAPAATPTTGA